MRLGYLSIMATGLAYASFVCTIPIGGESDVLSMTSHHTARFITKPKTFPKVRPKPKVKPLSSPKVASAGAGKHKTHPSSSSPRSIIYISYPTVEQVRSNKKFPASPYSCIAKQAEHKTIIQDFLEKAKTKLKLIGDPPQYYFTNPKKCICFENDPDVVFVFDVGSVGGEECKSETNKSLCQGRVESGGGGHILSPPDGEVIFTV